MKSRHFLNLSFQGLGLFCTAGLFFLVFFVVFFIVFEGGLSFVQTKIALAPPVSPPTHALSRDIFSQKSHQLFDESFKNTHPIFAASPSPDPWVGWAGYLQYTLLSCESPPSNGGPQPPLWVCAQDDVDALYKKTYVKTPLKKLFFSSVVAPPQALEVLRQSGVIKLVFHGEFFSNSDHPEPELAGVYGAFKGSVYVLFLALCLALPLGGAVAFYLEELAPSSGLTRWVGLHIHNLSAVPSVIFGLLGFEVLYQWFRLPRPSALLGGLTLSLMMCPVVIVMIRMNLQMVPQSFKEAARALGASPLQVALHHVLPVAFPGILRSILLIIGRFIGETAPLLMVGMGCFAGYAPTTFQQPATTMPLQVFLWAKSPEKGFLEKASGGILLILIAFILCNYIATFCLRPQGTFFKKKFLFKKQ